MSFGRLFGGGKELDFDCEIHRDILPTLAKRIVPVRPEL